MAKFIDVPKGQGDEIETPPRLFEALNKIYRFDVDLCATTKNTKLDLYFDNCLRDRSWAEDADVGFMNPPYSKPAAFLERAHLEADNGFTTVALIKGDPSTNWWNRHVAPFAQVTWFPTRIRFWYRDRPCRYVANFPSVLAVYYPPRMFGKLTLQGI